MIIFKTKFFPEVLIKWFQNKYDKNKKLMILKNKKRYIYTGWWNFYLPGPYNWKLFCWTWKYTRNLMAFRRRYNTLNIFFGIGFRIGLSYIIWFFIKKCMKRSIIVLDCYPRNSSIVSLFGSEHIIVPHNIS